MLAAQPAAAAPLRLAPTGEWRLLRNEASCELIRKFGSGDDALTLLLELSGPEAHFSFSLFGQPLQRVGRGEMQLRFGPDEKPTRRSYLYGNDGRGTPFVIMHGVRLAPSEPAGNPSGESDGWLGSEREAGITELSLSTQMMHPITLELGSMGTRLEEIRSCGRELTERLEGGPLKTAFSRQPVPLGSPSEWIVSSDYPPGLVWNGVEGTVRFRLVVSAKGMPVGCHIESATRNDVFEDTVCSALIKRARFDPALDGDGKPVAAYWRTSVRFVNS